MLQEIYQAPPAKIDLIPHGIPDVGFVDPTDFKDQFGVEGKVVLLTFGLLSPNKGIEYVLNALPHILAEFPDVVYIVLGATHPNELREHGEAYRLSLEILAKKNKTREERHLLQPVRRTGNSEGVHRRRRLLHHALSQRSADHVGRR
jgi:glycosyltransferase involved in cell wall biosynthesis